MQTPNGVQETPLQSSSLSRQAKGWFIALILIGLCVILALGLWFRLNNKSGVDGSSAKKEEEKGASGEQVDVTENTNTRVDVVTVSERGPTSQLLVPATVEANQEQIQQITPLTAGRADKIYVSLGDYVGKGTLLVSISSPQVAEMHGKLHEAETRLMLARQNLYRVQQAASRVGVLKAKATLDEADSTLKRTKQLVSEGLTAKKDLVAAQSEFDRAKADYNFQKDISLNRDVATAQAEVKTATTEIEHLRDALRALDAGLLDEGKQNEHDISTIQLKSPITGKVIERFVNPGAGFDQGKPLLSIANTASVWVIANVPEKQMSSVQVGMPVRVILGNSTKTGNVTYIDPRLNEDTRTARVRINLDNANNQTQIGAFAQVKFSQTAKTQATLFVPDSAVQTVNGRSVVFVQTADGKFAARPVSIEEGTSGIVPVLSGLKAGERVATNGAFVLKSKLLKEQFGDQD